MRAGDVRWSVASSAVDLTPRPTKGLIELLLGAARHALDNDLSSVARRGSPEQAAWTSLWPGEHYRLLAGLVSEWQPSVVIEIGTYHGLGSLALLDQLRADAKLVTFDVVPWQETPNCVLSDTDFADGRLEQRLGDLSDRHVFDRHRELLDAADLIFMDAPKDGRFEPAFLDLALPVLRSRPRLLVMDDIRLMPMVQLWRDLPLPKLDATTFGHWSGTGLASTG